MKVINVPHYESLNLNHILDFGLSYPLVVKALPVQREIRKMPRSYICTVIYTLVGQPFKTWVDHRCEDRNRELCLKQDLLIKLDEKVAKAFLGSTNISRKSIDPGYSFVEFLLTLLSYL